MKFLTGLKIIVFSCKSDLKTGLWKNLWRWKNASLVFPIFVWVQDAVRNKIRQLRRLNTFTTRLRHFFCIFFNFFFILQGFYPIRKTSLFEFKDIPRENFSRLELNHWNFLFFRKRPVKPRIFKLSNII